MPVTEDIHFLPPVGHRARRLAQIILVVVPFLYAALIFAIGQDANWDLRNYHWYNAYAFLNNRYDRDLLPSQTPYFYNPLLDVPYFLLATHLSAKLASYILTWVQGLNFVLLFMLSYATLTIPNPRQKVVACTALSALGVLGGGGIALLGTTFGDNLTSLGILTSALLVIRHHKILLTAPLPRVLARALLFGIPSGLMMGLKLPSVIFCVGLCFALLLAGGDIKRRFVMAFGFGLGVLVGVAIALGPWAWFLQTHFGSPLFPYFNEFFKSPYAPLTSARDIQFVATSWQDRLFFPYVFADSPYRVGEIPWRDWRIPLLYALLPCAVVLRLVFGRSRSQTNAVAIPFATRYLLWAAVISYFAWLQMFCIYRYVVPLEMLAPLLIVFAAGLLPVKAHSRLLLTVFALVVVAGSIQPGDWHHRATWLPHAVEADIPPLGDTSNTMVLMAGFQPFSHVVPEFPPSLSFVRIQSNFASPDQGKGINDLLRARIDRHKSGKGRFLILVAPWEHPQAEEALGYFGLAAGWQACQKVIDRLYDDGPLDLCPVTTVSE